MKSIFALSLILSPSGYALQDSCLKTTDNQHEEVLLCNESDYLKNYKFGCYQEAEICFTGNATDIVAKLNSSIFEYGDAGFMDASVIDSDHIKFVYWDLGDSCDHQVKKCE